MISSSGSRVDPSSPLLGRLYEGLPIEVRACWRSRRERSSVRGRTPGGFGGKDHMNQDPGVGVRHGRHRLCRRSAPPSYPTTSPRQQAAGGYSWQGAPRRWSSQVLRCTPGEDACSRSSGRQKTRAQRQARRAGRGCATWWDGPSGQAASGCIGVFRSGMWIGLVGRMQRRGIRAGAAWEAAPTSARSALTTVAPGSLLPGVSVEGIIEARSADTRDYPPHARFTSKLRPSYFLRGPQGCSLPLSISRSTSSTGDSDKRCLPSTVQLSLTSEVRSLLWVRSSRYRPAAAEVGA